MYKGVLLWCGPGEAATLGNCFEMLCSSEGIPAAIERLAAGGNIACAGAGSLAYGWKVPAGTVVAFTVGFMKFYGSDSAEYHQATARAERA